MFKKLKNFYEKITHKNDWKIYLYWNDQCIYKKYVNEDYAPMEHNYIIRVWGLKRFIGTNRPVKMIFQPFKYKGTIEENKEAHIEVIPFEGVDIR